MSKTLTEKGRNNPVGWILLGVVITVVIAVLGAWAAVTSGAIPANADSQPSALERWAARTSLNATVDRAVPGLNDPLPADTPTLTAGMKLYAANCMMCHGAADGMPSNVAVGLYQHAPQLGGHGVEDDPEGETYWKVSHGIRLTGMPAFSPTLTDMQIWQIATFLKHMDSLPPVVAAQWKREPSQASAASRKLMERFRPPGRPRGGGDSGPSGNGGPGRGGHR